MSAPLLLVADDLATIAAVKRVLAREGYEVVLATNAADAVIAFSHELPSLVLLQPSVETDRGIIVLQELKHHPDAQLLRVVLLGESIPGFALPVEPLPIDPEHFAATVNENSRDRQQNDWQVVEPQAQPTGAASALPRAPEHWRATHTTTSADEPTTAPAVPVSSDSLATRLFGDLPQMEDEMARDVEASAMASVESSLGLQPTPRDRELEALEAEVREEANRRRQKRLQELSVAELPSVTEADSLSSDSGETSFAGLTSSESDLKHVSPTAPAPVQVVREVMATDAVSRAEEMLNLASDSLDQHQQHASDTIAELSVQLQQLQAQLQTERDANRERVEALEADWLASLQKVDDLEKNNRRLESDLAQLHQRGADSEEGTQARIATLGADVEALRAELQRANELARANGEKAALLDLQLSEATGAHIQKIAELEAALHTAAGQGATEGEAHRLSAALAEERARDLQRTASELAETRRQSEARAAQVASLQAELAQTQQALVSAQDAIAALRRSSEEKANALQATLTAALEGAQSETAQLKRAHAEALRALTQERNVATAALTEATAALDTERQARAEQLTRLLGVEKELHQTRSDLEKSRVELQGTESKLTDLQDGLTRERARHAETQAQREQQRVDEAQALAQVKRDVESLGARLTEAEASNSALAAQLQQSQAALESARNEREALQQQLQSMVARVEASESAVAGLKTEKEAWEAKAVVSLALPGRRALGVARTGTVDLQGLATLVAQLVAAQADVRLELGAPGGSRTLWLRRGAVIAAESSIRSETLVDRARRDGLIDGRHELELRPLAGATTPEWLTILKTRGLLREAEAIPLVQRLTENLTLEAFTEPETNYRLSDEPPGESVVTVVLGRSTLSMLAEGLRRAMPIDSLLEQLGGSQAIPVSTDSVLEAKALGFSDRERKMLSWVNAEATVEDVVLASGLKPDAAYRALLVAKLLGLVTLQKPTGVTAVVSHDIDVRRLDAKYDEIQDADYFTILGLQRGAGTDEVRRAHARLSMEFDPIRFSTHPDAGVHQRAQVVHDFIEEAARALEDDRRRIEYARHLLD